LSGNEPLIPHRSRFLWLTLKALENLGDTDSNPVIEKKAIELGGFSDQQLAVPGTGRYTKVTHELAWSRSMLKAVGALENPKDGTWSITDFGRSLREEQMHTVTADAASSMRRKG
jgi:restriction system protein